MLIDTNELKRIVATITEHSKLKFVVSDNTIINKWSEAIQLFSLQEKLKQQQNVSAIVHTFICPPNEPLQALIEINITTAKSFTAIQWFQLLIAIECQFYTTDMIVKYFPFVK